MPTLSSMAKRFMLFMMALAAGITTVPATMVALKDHDCPVCGKTSKTMVLMSYSQFGEPARDSIFGCMPFFGGAEICPFDLHAARRGRWKIDDPREVKSMREFLANPALVLTPEEKRLIGGKLKQLQGSRLLELLWARTCEQVRAPVARGELMMGLSLYYETAGEKQALLVALHRHYRTEVIRLLGVEIANEDADWKDKMAYTYLRAELQRRSGLHDQARDGFAWVIKDARKRGINAADENVEMSWAPRWAKEQSALNDRRIATEGERREEDGDLIRARSALLPAARAALRNPAAFPPTKMNPDDVLDGLEKLIEDGTDEEAKLAARMFTRQLRLVGEEPRVAAQYGLSISYISKRKDLLAPEILKELNGEWRSAFWENVSAYMARRDGAAAALASHPLVMREWEEDGRPFETFLWRRFGEFGDPIWVEKAVKELSRKKWIPGGALDYARSVDDPRLTAALEKRHAWLAKRGRWKPGGHKADDVDEMLLDHEAQEIEDWMRARKLAAMPIK